MIVFFICKFLLESSKEVIFTIMIKKLPYWFSNINLLTFLNLFRKFLMCFCVLYVLNFIMLQINSVVFAVLL